MGLLALHRSLLPRFAGASRYPGGAELARRILLPPLEADFIPPPPELVPALLDDLMAYLNSAAHRPAHPGRARARPVRDDPPLAGGLCGFAYSVGPAGHTGVDDPDGVENLRGIADRGVPRSGDLEVRRYSDDRIHRSE